MHLTVKIQTIIFGMVGCLIMTILTLTTITTPAIAGQLSMGQPIIKNGIKVDALFIQSVVTKEAPMDHSKMGHNMDHSKMGHNMNHEMNKKPAPPMNHHSMSHGTGHSRADSDIHLEAGLHAVKNNPNGFLEGSWIPYVKVDYVLKKHNSDWTLSGTLIPMAASGGPHYGDNVKLSGPGNYHLTYTIHPPTIPYHADKETGVQGWWKPFTSEWNFPFFGAGKKGGY